MPLLDAFIPPKGPIRTLCLSHFSKTVANGILMSVAVLYFTRTVRIEPDKVGLALTVGAAFGMLAAIPAGRLADARARATSLWCCCACSACSSAGIRWLAISPAC